MRQKHEPKNAMEWGCRVMFWCVENANGIFFTAEFCASFCLTIKMIYMCNYLSLENASVTTYIFSLQVFIDTFCVVPCVIIVIFFYSTLWNERVLLFKDSYLPMMYLNGMPVNKFIQLVLKNIERSTILKTYVFELYHLLIGP